jgi:hypothetical protein
VKKSILRKLLDYCPEPAEPLIKILKRYSVPTAVAISVSIILASFLLLAQTALSQSTLLPPPPLVTTEYNPGVSVGDYVVYGNFVCNREHPEEVVCITNLAFKKMEVIAVSGKEVTFLHSQQFKNGTATWHDGRTETWDVEKAMWSEDTADYVDASLIIAANLTEGDCIQSDPAPQDYYVAETVVREYLGVSRNVSILHMRDMVDDNGEPCEVTHKVVYDQVSGIRLESALVTLDGDLLSSMSVVETNIFSAPTASSVAPLQEDNTASNPPVALYVAIGSAIAVFVMSVVILRKKRLRGGEKTVE